MMHKILILLAFMCSVSTAEDTRTTDALNILRERTQKLNSKGDFIGKIHTSKADSVSVDSSLTLAHQAILRWSAGMGDSPITLISNGQALELNKELRIRSDSGLAALFGVSNTNGNARAFASDRPVDTYNLFQITVDGQHWWGPGNANADVHFYRSGVSEMRMETDAMLWKIYGRVNAAYPTTGKGYFALTPNYTNGTYGGLTIQTLNNGVLYDRMLIDQAGKINLVGDMYTGNTIYGRVTTSYPTTYPTSGEGYYAFKATYTNGISGGLIIQTLNNGTLYDRLTIDQIGAVTFASTSMAQGNALYVDSTSYYSWRRLSDGWVPARIGQRYTDYGSGYGSQMVFDLNYGGGPLDIATKMILDRNSNLTIGVTSGSGTGGMFAGHYYIGASEVINSSRYFSMMGGSLTDSLKVGGVAKLNGNVIIGGGGRAPSNQFVISNSGAQGWEFRGNDGAGGVDVLSYNRTSSAFTSMGFYASSYTFNSGVVQIPQLTLTTPLASPYIGSHTHAESDITSLVSDLSNKSNVGHGHNATEIVNGVVWRGSLASAPASPSEGWMYYNTTSSTIKVYTGAAWH